MLGFCRIVPPWRNPGLVLLASVLRFPVSASIRSARTDSSCTYSVVATRHLVKFFVFDHAFFFPGLPFLTINPMFPVARARAARALEGRGEGRTRASALPTDSLAPPRRACSSFRPWRAARPARARNSVAQCSSAWEIEDCKHILTCPVLCSALVLSPMF